MTTPVVASPVGASPSIVEAGAEQARAEVIVDTAEAVFAGHYPGLPIFPGVCLVEYVRLAAMEQLPASASASGGWRLAAIESSRFLSPVFPADRLTIDCAWSAEATVRRCSATVSTDRGVAARVRVRFASGEPAVEGDAL
jgi:3-hydroxyacyl-[acyl-carrier-protein] dehydratase